MAEACAVQCIECLFESVFTVVKAVLQKKVRSWAIWAAANNLTVLSIVGLHQ